MVEVSIAIPVYNVEKFVEESVLSALNQDFKFSYEILIVDDCGSDDSMKIVNSIVQNHPRGGKIRIIHHDNNQGIGAARNTAIAHATGKYLFFLDSDDTISTDCLSLLYEKAEKEQSDITIGSIVGVEEGTKNVISTVIYDNQSYECQSVGVYLCRKGIYIHKEVWNKLYRMSFVKQYDLHCIHRILEDCVFDFESRVNATKISTIPSITLTHFQRSDSIMQAIFHEKCTDDTLFVLTDYINYIRKQIIAKYSVIPGIYTLYFQRLCDTVNYITSFNCTEEQINYLEKQLDGFNSFVPAIGCLDFKVDRLIYIMCHVHQSIGMLLFVERFSAFLIKSKHFVVSMCQGKH